MSTNFEMIKNYYDVGLWTKQRVYKTVGKKIGITAEEYELITGEAYTAEQ